MSAIKSLKRNRKSRPCRAFRSRTIDYIERSVASWQVIFGRSLDLPSFDQATCPELAKAVKSFLGLEVSNLPEEQLSFQSIKKGLPDSCKCMEKGALDGLARSIGNPPRKLPDGYLSFVKKEVKSLFKKGWDSSYEKFCLTTSPPLSSVYVPEATCPSSGSRSTGGCLNWFSKTQEGERPQDWYLDAVLNGKWDGFRGSTLVGKLILVQSAGKPRPLSKFESSALLLKPLHKTIFGHLKRFPWLLVGPPTRQRLAKAGFRQGKGALVSGDYKSATDGLSIEVAEVILRSLLDQVAFVPSAIAEGALAALRPLLFYGDDDEFNVSVSTGQMMGSYLSFPLLCLQNYLAFRWSLRGLSEAEKRVPLLINGDDILFQKDNHFYKWESSISSIGLTVETTKTSVESDWGTINSTLLRWNDGLLDPCWSARFGMFRPAEHPGSLGMTFSSFLSGCDSPDVRFRAGREFFKWHLGELRSSGVSPVSLGFRGLLARRLSKLFDLLELPLTELPPAYKRHEVGYDADFVSRHDLSALSEEELFMSSLELGSQKWGKGWKGTDYIKTALRYCIARSASKFHRFDYNFDGRPWGSSDSEFRFLLRNLSTSCKSKAVSSKAFLSPFPPRESVLVAWSVLQSLAPLDGEFESLPAYRVVEEPLLR
ncbi:RNA dependent RNA polymerase [Plasmopara viticola lesion associated ourmia-like virus 44]|uniref:RNA dependent RNA polymerase n=1 Tax=Plasmopara viticola lesion associated ourmia-like virus 44 TaxID=2686514 RepID=A0ABX6FIZ3_9VIRU|nr:RNA dependent RNA polymerase [Plasmopara viticola lesion associated ourmia-like virus 44]QGY72574.1 RNA dependent RNA polymerase [Plasmopara viticola lesion associated ourmia-like virus 44]